jgi:hypothetical protein
MGSNVYVEARAVVFGRCAGGDGAFADAAGRALGQIRRGFFGEEEAAELARGAAKWLGQRGYFAAGLDGAPISADYRGGAVVVRREERMGALSRMLRDLRFPERKGTTPLEDVGIIAFRPGGPCVAYPNRKEHAEAMVDICTGLMTDLPINDLDLSWSSDTPMMERYRREC